MIKKSPLLFLLLTALSFALPHNAETSWHKAVERTKKENKNILVVFSGSTWCPPCIELNNNVLQKDEFYNQIKDTTVFLYLDFPKPMPPEDEKKYLAILTSDEKQDLLLKKNLKDKYNIIAFPTLILMDKDQMPLKNISTLTDDNQPTTTAVLSKKINETTQKFNLLTQEYNNATTDSNKGITLSKYLKFLPLSFLNFHHKKIKELEILAPKKAIALLNKIKQEKELNILFSQCDKFTYFGEIEKARKLLQENVDKYEDKDIKQRLTFYQSYTYRGTIDELDDIEKIFDATIAINPTSSLAIKAKVGKEKIALFRAQQKK